MQVCVYVCVYVGKYSGFFPHPSLLYLFLLSFFVLQPLIVFFVFLSFSFFFCLRRGETDAHKGEERIYLFRLKLWKFSFTSYIIIIVIISSSLAPLHSLVCIFFVSWKVGCKCMMKERS